MYFYFGVTKPFFAIECNNLLAMHCRGDAACVERAHQGGLSFDDFFTRKVFIARVFLILSIQLLGILALVCLAIASENFFYDVEGNDYLLQVAAAILFCSLISLMCCTEGRRTEPLNYIYFVLFSLVLAFFMSIVATIYDPNIAISALSLTLLVTLSLSLYGIVAEFTVEHAFILVCVMVTATFAIVLIYYHSFMVAMLFCSLGVLVFSTFLIIHIQMMVDGEHYVEIKPEEYVFAALALYVDTVQMFGFLCACLLHFTGLLKE